MIGYAKDALLSVRRPTKIVPCFSLNSSSYQFLKFLQQKQMIQRGRSAIATTMTNMATLFTTWKMVSHLRISSLVDMQTQLRLAQMAISRQLSRKNRMKMLPCSDFLQKLRFLWTDLQQSHGFVKISTTGKQRIKMKTRNMVPKLLIMKLLSKPNSANFSIACSSSSYLGIPGIAAKISSLGMTSKFATVMRESISLVERAGNSMANSGRKTRICKPLIMPQTQDIAPERAILTPIATAEAAQADSAAAPTSSTALTEADNTLVFGILI